MPRQKYGGVSREGAKQSWSIRISAGFKSCTDPLRLTWADERVISRELENQFTDWRDTAESAIIGRSQPWIPANWLCLSGTKLRGVPS